MSYGKTTHRLLDAMEYTATGKTSSALSKVVNAPTAVLVHDPLEDIEAIVNAFRDADEDAAGISRKRAPNTWLQKRRGRKQQVSQRQSGLLVYDGRRCCMEHLHGMNTIISRLRLPYRTKCPTCHATFDIEQRVRRAHG